MRIGHLLKRQGKESHEVDALGPGDIGAVGKIDEVHFDAVLHEGHDLDSVHLANPSRSRGPCTGSRSSSPTAPTSPSSRRRSTSSSRWTRVSRSTGSRRRARRSCAVWASCTCASCSSGSRTNRASSSITEPPKVAYKESITGKSEATHRHKKQTGGAGQFGEVHLRVEPLPNDHPTGFEFVNATVGGSIPKQFMPAIEKGVRQVLEHGAVAGYPMSGVRVEVFDGKHHPVDSKEIAFMTAGKKAFIEAIEKAHPVLLEPFVHLEVTVPADKMGDIAGDLSTKRGRVQDTQMLPGEMCAVIAEAPLGELQNFSTELKSITGGTGPTPWTTRTTS